MDQDFHHWSGGVIVQSNSTARLHSGTVCWLAEGIKVQTTALAVLHGWKVSQCGYMGVAVDSGGSATLDHCTLSERGGCALHVRECRSHAKTTHCHIANNSNRGACASDYGRIEALSCISFQNGLDKISEFGGNACGYRALEDGVLELSKCTSTGDQVGCRVYSDAKLTAHQLHVAKSVGDEITVESSGVAELRERSSTKCGGLGLLVGGLFDRHYEDLSSDDEEVVWPERGQK